MAHVKAPGLSLASATTSWLYHMHYSVLVTTLQEKNLLLPPFTAKETALERMWMSNWVKWPVYPSPKLKFFPRWKQVGNLSRQVQRLGSNPGLFPLSQKLKNLTRMGRGNILPSLVSYSKSELKFMSIGMIHRLDRGQHRAASRVFSTLSLESSGANKGLLVWILMN